MEVLITAIVILGSAVVIISGIWVAIALGSAISTGRKKNNAEDSAADY